MTMTRDDVKEEDRWNVEAIYPSLKDWEADYSKFLNGQNKLEISKLLKFKGRLGESPETLKQFIDEYYRFDRKISVLYTYAHLRHDEDITNTDYKTSLSKIVQLLHTFSQEMSWFEPELTNLSDETIKYFLEAPVLKDYRFALEKIFRFKKHILPPEQEELLALAGPALSTANKAFSALNDADLKFGEAIDSEGKSHPITHGSYQVLLKSQDRTLRENAFKTYFGVYDGYENTLAELINGAVQRNVYNAKARKYKSALEAALFANNIDPSVYHSLIETVKSNLKPLHDYYALRKKILKLPEIHLYDMSVPLTKSVDIRLPYDEAEQSLIEAFKPLGSEYQGFLEKGLKTDRWVDRYENKNKRSGAYSSGCYDTSPYILMNYKSLLRDVFTLAHEAGHSMHSFYTRKNQPYQYGDYPIFLAEVASTFNEELLSQYFIKKLTSKEERIFLITEKLDDIRATLFRQTMFAEFELKIHSMAENHIPLTPQSLSEVYYELAKTYFGENVVVDDLINIEWGRIPHFYYNFYVFQYATGISAALALATRVMNGGKKEQEEYLAFLKSGSSKYPIETLKLAGVDMSSPAPVVSAINHFAKLTQELSSLIN